MCSVAVAVAVGVFDPQHTDDMGAFSPLRLLPALCLVPVWHRRLKSKVDYSGAFGAEGSDEGELFNEAGPRHAQQRPCIPNAIRATLVSARVYVCIHARY